MATGELLGALVLAGLMGLVGQGARSVIGLKKLYDLNAVQPPDAQDAFVASKLLVSLLIGFIAGVLAALALGLEKLTGAGGVNAEMLLGLAAAGYSGADFIEGFMAKTPAIAPTPAMAQTPAVAGGAGQPVVPVASPPAPLPGTELSSLIDLQTSQIQADIASLKTVMTGGTVENGWSRLSGGTQLTPELVWRLFVPATPLANIRTHLPSVLAGLRSYGLADRDMLLMALATIRAETEGFVPIDEFKSKYNTDKAPFDLYEPGTPAGKRLGNTQPGDGALFKGRGFVQLTGRYNYTETATQTDLNILLDPPLANDSKAAGLILAQFLANKEDTIRAALAVGDLKGARKLVNGGSHGLDRFRDAYNRGLELIPEGIEI